VTAAAQRVSAIVSDLAHVPARWSVLSQPTPAHMRHAALYRNEPTACMKLGTAGHAVTFDVPYEVFRVENPKTGKVWNRNAKAWDEFEADCEARGVVPLTVAEYDKASAIRDALRGNPDAEALLFGAGVVRERRLVWERDGRACASIPDARRAGDFVADLKVVRSADPAPYRFPLAAKRAGYPGQLMFYREADCYERGVHVESLSCADLYNVAVESSPPYAVTVFRLDPTAREFGQRLLASRWELFRSCEAVNVWPAYSQSIVPLVIEEDRIEGDDYIDPPDEADQHDQEDL
jgi:hypothetical protein